MEPTNETDRLLADVLAEQRRQTKYLKSMNTVLQLWGLLLVLGIVVGLCYAVSVIAAIF